MADPIIFGLGLGLGFAAGWALFAALDVHLYRVENGIDRKGGQERDDG